MIRVPEVLSVAGSVGPGLDGCVVELPHLMYPEKYFLRELVEPSRQRVLQRGIETRHNPPEASNMPKEAVDLSANQRAFILEAIQRNVRLDGRQFDQFRALDLTFGAEHGNVKVQLGKTWYYTQIFLFEPPWDGNWS